MATIREYYEADFNYTVRMHVRVPIDGEEIEGSVLLDFAGHSAFLACYIPEADRNLDFFLKVIQFIDFGKTEVKLNGRVTLPSPRHFPGEFRVENKPDFEIFAHFWADTNWISSKELAGSRRVFFYSESNLVEDELRILKERGKRSSLEIQFRSRAHQNLRNMMERPLAFVCHDSRDKETIARPLAIGLQTRRCPVWFDEFSLQVGDHLRESIEKGLKECRRCILILSQSFLANKGWTKVEFNSIFTRELIERRHLVLPIWCGVGG